MDDPTLYERVKAHLGNHPSAGRQSVADAIGISPHSKRLRRYIRAVKRGEAPVIRQKADAAESPAGGNLLSTDYGKDKASVTTRSADIRTLDGALAAANVDLKTWEVERHVINSWEVSMGAGKSGTDTPETFTNFQVKVWLKRISPEFAAIEDLIRRLEGNSPVVPTIKRQLTPKRGSRILELSIADPHLGMRCHRPGSDAPWTIEQCEVMAMSAVDRLLEQAEVNGPYDYILFPFGNDFLHSDNIFHTTTAGTGQPESESWQHIYTRGEDLAIAMVERMKAVAPVQIVTVMGNHARQSEFTLGRILRAYYRNDENVEVDASASPYKFHKYGVNLIGYEHGHSVAAIRLAALMANECRLNGWQEARYCEWHLGDQHRKGSSKPSMHEEQGVSVEYLPGLTPPNEWHRIKAFNWQKRGAMAFVWDERRGPVTRHQVNIDSYTGGFMGE